MNTKNCRQMDDNNTKVNLKGSVSLNLASIISLFIYISSGENRYKNLPDYSLRVRGTIHSKAHALKDIGLYDNINQVLEESINELLKRKAKIFKMK